MGGARGGTWLPRMGSAVETALVQFSVRTLLRSRLHRIILAFYLGVGFAVVIAMVKNGAPPSQLADAPAADPWSQVNEPLLAATITMMGFAMIGTRVAFSIPLDLRGNWIFRVTGARSVPECLRGARRSLLLLSAAPDVDSLGRVLLPAMAVAGGRGSPGDTHADGADARRIVFARIPQDPVHVLVSAGQVAGSSGDTGQFGSPVVHHPECRVRAAGTGRPETVRPGADRLRRRCGPVSGGEPRPTPARRTPRCNSKRSQLRPSRCWA